MPRISRFSEDQIAASRAKTAHAPPEDFIPGLKPW